MEVRKKEEKREENIRNCNNNDGGNNRRCADNRSSACLIILAGICWGLIGIFTRYLTVQGIGSVQSTFIRNLVAGVGMAVIILVTNRRRFQISLKDIWMFFGTGICSIVLFNICYFQAIEITTMSVAAILLYTAPCIVLVMSCLFFKERLTVQKVAALILAFAGCILTTGVIGSEMSLSVTGILLGLGSGFGYALYSIFGSVALRKYHPFTVTFYTFLFAAVSLFPFCGWSEIVDICRENWGTVIYGLLLGVISTLLPFILYTKGLERTEPGRASIMAFVEPLTATVCGIMVFHEKMTVENSMGIFLIFCSVILLNAKKKRKIGSSC